jgi:single-strand DNA-binding protein
MAGAPSVTFVGNLTADPELRFTPSGAAVANFTVAQTPRKFDKQTNEWTDLETLFVRCSVWRRVAENVAESLQRGMRVVVTGELEARSYEKDGQKHTVWECRVEEIGPSLRYATAKMTRVERSDGGSQDPGGYGGGGSQERSQYGGGRAGGPQDDPWATPSSSGGGRRGGYGDDGPPF